MIAIPAIELRDGACVFPADGPHDTRRSRLVDPIGVARELARVGFTRLHLVDLDATAGRGVNAALAADVVRDGSMEVQLSGGLRQRERIEDALELGARWAVVGPRALQDLDWLAEMAAEFPEEIIVATEVRQGRIAMPGWTRSMPRDAVELVEELADLPLGGLLVAAVGRDGRTDGPDLRLVEDVVEVARVPVLASGGIATIAHLRNLEDRGAAAVVIGDALYTGSLSPAAVAAEFAAWQ